MHTTLSGLSNTLMYRLYCYVREDDYNRVFEVKIGMEESVAALKKALKEKKKPEFDHIPADSLLLWNVPVSINRNLKENVEALNVIDHDPLLPSEILKDILPSELKKGTVYIVVDRPPPATSPFSFLQLFCYVKGEHYEHVFEVKISKEETVAALKEAIKEKKKPEFDHIPADSLLLWNVPVSINRNLKENVEALNLIGDNPLLPSETLKNILPFELKKRTVYIIVDRPLPPSNPSSFLRLFCYVKGGHSEHVFEVKIGKEESVAALKKVIKEEKKPDFDHIPADSLLLWNVKIPCDEHLKEAVDKLGIVKEKPLSASAKLSNVVPHRPADGHLHIVVSPVSTISPSTSNSSNLLDSPPRWLVEIHGKLWGRHHLFGQIFRTAYLTKDDFIALQYLLQEQNPNRNSASYIAKNVLATKSAFLRTISTADFTSDAPLGGGSGDLLVPRLVFDASQGLTQPTFSGVVDEDADDEDTDDVVDEDANASDAVVDNGMQIDPDPSAYIHRDADYLSTGTTAIFPCTIQYMDLAGLELENNIRVPQLTLIRKEWGTMVDIFNERQKGLKGSAVFTGQPGIGKTCLLYSLLIHCIIHAQPVVFQDVHGRVFIVDETVRRHKGTPDIPIDDVLTLIDADGESCQPYSYLFDAPNLRILLTSSPMNRKDRKRLTQFVGETEAVFVMEPWSREELLITSLFLANIDITLKRFQETSDICGLIPRPCFEAAVSPDMLRGAKLAIIAAIKNTEELFGALVDVHRGATTHHAFQIWPLPESRRWNSCLTEVVSDWAFSKIMAALDLRSKDAAYKFYCAIQGSTHSSGLGRRMFETKLYEFFHDMTKPQTFTIHSLDNHSTTFDIEFSSNTQHRTFGAIKFFAGKLSSSLKQNKSCYLVPLCPVFPTFDFFLYQHGMSQAGCSPLIGLQVTTVTKHPISITSMEKVQRSLNKKITSLNNLQPLKDGKLIILFVVPDPIGAAFVRQKIEGAKRTGHWYEKTSQFVLVLPAKEVFQVM